MYFAQMCERQRLAAIEEGRPKDARYWLQLYRRLVMMALIVGHRGRL
jgi:hypothetical protein